MGVEDLRTLFLFEGLSDDQLAWIAARGWELRLPEPTMLFAEGAAAENFYVLLEGEIQLLKRDRESVV